MNPKSLIFFRNCAYCNTLLPTDELYNTVWNVPMCTGCINRVENVLMGECEVLVEWIVD